MSFKIGQKVVYIGGCVRSDMRLPKTGNEVVEISEQCPYRSVSYSLSGYERSDDGQPQWFHKDHLRPLDYNFVEEVIKQVQPKEEIC